MALSVSSLGWFLSPTRKIIDCWKADGDRRHRGEALRKWSRGLFYAELFGLITLCVLFREQAPGSPTLVGILLLLYAVSRINEIAYAFYRDPLSPAKESDLTPIDRVRMAMRSYFGLGFNFAVVYYFAPVTGLFKSGDASRLGSFAESVYFSGVTLATLGYGDVVPLHSFSRLAALAEVFAGLLVLAVAIAAYIGSIKGEEI